MTELVQILDSINTSLAVIAGTFVAGLIIYMIKK